LAPETPVTTTPDWTDFLASKTNFQGHAILAAALETLHVLWTYAVATVADTQSNGAAEIITKPTPQSSLLLHFPLSLYVILLTNPSQP
jgi:hypothetical protein